MNILIGDIGNTITKICLVHSTNYKINKITYFESKNILSKKKLEKLLFKVIKKKNINHSALFSSVVPKYFLKIKKILKKK